MNTIIDQQICTHQIQPAVLAVTGSEHERACPASLLKKEDTSVLS